jgi:MFS family permease
MQQAFAGYGRVFKDTPFLAFIGVTVMMTLVYMNMNSTLGAYLHDQHGLPEIRYGWLLSINAIIVVLFQFWVTRRLEKYKPFLMMAAGSLLYAIGFAMYGFVPTFALFIVAMIIITVGEMVVSPFQQSLVASFAPEDMRGRYMAVSGLSWSISFTVGPYFAGLILDGSNPSLLWAFCGIVGMLATLGFIALNKARESTVPAIEPAAAD